jgi:hypothetical protein
MAYFEYEAQNKQGRKIKGTIVAESKTHLAEMLEEMGYTPTRMAATELPAGKLTFYYVGTDKHDRHVEGTIVASDEEDACEKLNRMGYKDFRCSTQSNLDVPYDDTTADKVAKGIAPFMILAIFITTAIVSFSFPEYWEAINLEENSRVTYGKVVERKENSGLVQYSFEVEGRAIKRYGYLSRGDREKFHDGDTIPIR